MVVPCGRAKLLTSWLESKGRRYGGRHEEGEEDEEENEDEEKEEESGIWISEFPSKVSM